VSSAAAIVARGGEGAPWARKAGHLPQALDPNWHL